MTGTAYILLCALLMLQDGTTQGPQSAGSQAEPTTTSETIPAAPPTSPGDTPEKIQDLITTGDYLPLPQAEVERLQKLARHSRQPESPAIRTSSYKAELQGRTLNGGTLEYDLYNTDTASAQGLLLGRTSLQKLQLRDPRGPLPIAADLSRRLCVLKPGLTGNITGSWTADGLVSGDTTIFRLELPASTATQLQLRTPAETEVTGLGCLVLGPQPADSGLVWELHAAEPARIAFSCRRTTSLQTSEPLALTAFSASHVLNGDIMSSRWTIGLPQNIRGVTLLTAQLSPNTRVTAVKTDENRSLQWDARLAQNQQILAIQLPESGSTGSLTISAASVIPDADRWDLPALSMQRWLSSSEIRGDLLSPTGIVSVSLPATVNVDNWTLYGMQERDVVPGPDQSRTYQLTQFSSTATATIRTSTRAAVLSDAVATVMEPAGQLAAVRCFINVRCTEAAVIELKWPISPGWQTVAARYASDARVLYFEQPTADGTDAAALNASSMLTVHLPETLEPDTSRVIELRLQQLEHADPARLQPPLSVSAGIERTSSWLLYSPRSQTQSRLPARWTTGQQTASIPDFLSDAPWFPANGLPENTLCFFAGDTLTQPPAEVQPAKCDVKHQMRTDGEGVIVEDLQVEFAATANRTSMVIRLASEFADELSWKINGEAVLPAWRAVAGNENLWRDAVFALPAAAAESTLRISGSIRRTIAGEFIAAIPFLPEAEVAGSVMTVPRSDLKILQVVGLEEHPDYISNEQYAGWTLPALPQPIVVQRLRQQIDATAQSADVANYHVIRERAGLVEHQMLAVVDVSGRSGGSLQIDADQTQPHVLVDGRRVAATITPTGLQIPIPDSRDRCRIVLAWEPELCPIENIRSRVVLSRVRSVDGSGLQFVHHLLIAPELEPELPTSEFRVVKAATAPEPVELVFSDSDDAASPANAITSLTSGPHATTLQFQLLWKLTRSRDWSYAWLVQPAGNGSLLKLEVTQKQRRQIVAAGMGVVFFGLCLSCSAMLLRNPPAAALPVILLSLAGIFDLPPVVQAALQGAFWGNAAGLLLIMSARGLVRYLRSFSRTPVLNSLVLLFAVLSQSTSAQETPNPGQAPAPEAATLPDDAVVRTLPQNSPMTWIRRSYLQQLRQLQSERSPDPSAVIRSVRALVTAETTESVQLELQLNVSVPSGDEAAALSLPIRGARLVDCTVDGQQVFPDPELPEQISIPIPASRAVPQIPIAVTAPSGRAKPADEVAAFSDHVVICRLRPTTVRQPSGLQFRLPTPPGPDSEIRIETPKGLFSTARLQTADGILQWNPADGPVQFNGLADGDGIDVRLLQTDLERRGPNLATVEVMTVAENTTGLQNLSCYCRFVGWNPLSPEIRYHIPEGFRLLSASAAAGLQSPDLLWSVENQSAVITLPRAVPADFILHLQLRSTRAIPLQQQVIPIHQLNHFDDCKPADTGILALRASSIFAPYSPDRSAATPLSFADVSARWGPWLRRSDLIFETGKSTESLLVTAPDRAATNEVRILQECTFAEQNMNWSCRMDVETSTLAVFRHRITVPEQVVVRKVEVSAGEANRLASWHRQGNVVILLLREGTTGLHAITLEGSRTLLPDDSKIQLAAPTLENSQILESSLILTDQSGSGLAFSDTGDSVSDPPLKPGDALQKGVSLRLTVVGETRPICLTRQTPVDPLGAVAAWWLPDRMQFAVRLSQWPAALGPLEMTFPDNTEFISEPVVVLGLEKLTLQRTAGRFYPDSAAIRTLFGKSEFTVTWSLPLPDRKSASNAQPYSLNWPLISDRILWTDMFVFNGSTESRSAESRLPSWATEIDRTLLAAPAARSAESAGRFDASALIAGSRIQLPIAAAPADPDSGPGNSLVAVSATVISAIPGQSPAAETEYLVFSRTAPFTCILEIPDNVAITELPNGVEVNWEDATRRRLIVNSTTNLTQIRLRWLGRLAPEHPGQSRIQFTVPFVRNSQQRQHLWIVSPLREMPSTAPTVETLTSEQQQLLLEQDLRTGISLLSRNSAFRPDQNVATTELLSGSLAESVSLFLNRKTTDAGQRTIRLHRTVTDPVTISFRRHLELTTIIPIGVAMFVMVLAVMSASATVRADYTLTTVVTVDNSVLRVTAGQMEGTHSEASAALPERSSAGPGNVRN
jgi:hypothetical protein